MEQEFNCKTTSILSGGLEIKFNGANIGLFKSVYTLSHHDHLERPKEIDEFFSNESESVIHRARGAYIIANARSDLRSGFDVASKVTVPKSRATRLLATHIKQVKQSCKRRFLFVNLDSQSVQLRIFSDSRFPFNHDLTSRLESLIFLAENHGNAYISHESSKKSKRISRNVLATEMFAAVRKFYFTSTTRVTINEIIERRIPLVLYTVSKSLFRCIGSLSLPSEKRCIIDLCMLRQCYELRELRKVVWTPSAQNPADALTGLTGKKSSGVIINLMHKNKLCKEEEDWIDRPIKKKFEKLKTDVNTRSECSAKACTDL